MQLRTLHRLANLRAGVVGIALCGVNGLALATAGDGLFAKPFRPDFHPVARVSCPQSVPLPRTLIDAAACGDLFRLRARIAEGGDLATVDARQPLRGRTALHHAVQRGDKDAVEALLAAGANPDVADAAGNSAMHLLAMRPRKDSDVAVVEMLIQAGADFRLRNEKGRSPLAELLKFTASSVDPMRIGVAQIGAMLDEAEAKGPQKPRLAQPTPAAEGLIADTAVLHDEALIVETATSAALQSAETSVREALAAWAGAWSARNIDAYLSHYASDFRPADGRPLEQWRILRRERIGGASSIDVKLTDMKILVDGSRAVAHFRQDYHSDALKSVDQKTVVLNNVAGDWRIVEEKTGK